MHYPSEGRYGQQRWDREGERWAAALRAGLGARLAPGKHMALVVIDMLVGFTDPRYKLGADQGEVPGRIESLLAAARTAPGVEVVHVTTAYERGEERVLLEKIPTLREFEVGSEAVRIIQRLAPQPGELLITKRLPSAFFDTELLSELRCRQVDGLILAGCSTSGCVRATATDAMSYGFRVIVPQEAVFDRLPAAHLNSLLDIDAKFGDVVSIDVAEQILRGRLCETIAYNATRWSGAAPAAPDPVMRGSDPVHRQNQTKTATEATNKLRTAILDGRFPAGQRLKEADLARELEVSRTPIREALLALSAERLVELEPNRGASVRPYALDDLDEMYRLRALLEGYAAERAATRIDEDQLKQLRVSLDRIERFDVVTELDSSVTENLRFHEIVIAAAQSPRLADMLEVVTRVPSVYRSYYWYTDPLRAISQQFHEWLLRALWAREPERARRIATEHVLHARDVLVDHFRQVSD